jgi:DNA replication protein DnaC
MAVDPILLAKARKKLDRDVEAHRRRRLKERERLYAEQPRLEELEKAIKDVFLNALKTLSQPAIERASEESLEYQREREQILAKMGVPATALDETPLCGVCNDTGYHNHKLCVCLQERCRAVQAAELSSLLDLRGQSFGTFNAALFSGEARQNSELLREVCLRFCETFGEQSDHLLFSGPPGTGKTFLSACVAGKLADSGFSVVYDTAVSLVSQMENEQFYRRENEGQENVERMMLCDLLIIDDLGAEFLTAFTQSALLNLVNTRIITGKKMLVSTNLDRGGITARYSPALASRLTGEFIRLDFFGEDLRQKKYE